jgi:hypothetical protein
MANRNDRNAREIMRNNIERDPVGRNLTPAAKEAAIDFAVDVWKGDMGNGLASDLGIKAVTHDVLKRR